MESDNPFEQSMNCFTKQEKVTSNSNCDVNFMLIRSLSMTGDGFYAASVANQLSNGTPKYAIRMLCDKLVAPNSRKRRWGYIKKAKKDLTELQKLHINLVEKFFHISPSHAEEVYKLLIAQGVDMKEVFGQKAVLGSKRLDFFI